MIKTERILLIIIFFATVLNYSRITGSTLLLILACLILSILYAYFSLGLLNGLGIKEMFKKTSYKDIAPLRIIGSILVGFTLSTAVVGLLFRLLLWPGGSIMLVMAFFGLVISFILSLIKYQKKNADFYGQLLVRLGFYLFVSLTFYFIPTIKLIEIKYSIFPDFVEAHRQLLEDPTNPELIKKLEIEQEKINTK